ncbi:MAG: nitrate reductase cytochrome c-type subunit [Gammaproteobacteria bacterium]|nr:nitrate reductase cytochrome c-type subunit [Gammaproteobacteria bacterium]
MKHLIKYLVIPLGLAFTAQSLYAIESLRGGRALDKDPEKPVAKKWQRDQPPIERDYVQQPPLVPHSIEGYVINTRSNKCMSCHSWSNYKDKGATKVSLTHFKDRKGNEHANISPRRYFCTQCHVPQVDAKPLVKNTFKPVKTIKSK